MLFYILNIFLSAFLLFQIQPMIAKYILPWFGGTPAVWSSVQMYFQILLTGGYAYAHWLIGCSRVPRRELVHLILLALALVQMLALGLVWNSPITPGLNWRPLGSAYPVWEIFKLLTISVGPAYFLLSTNSPIMQAWFNRADPQRSPYVLYALSNLGSLLALVTYPIFLEPNFTLIGQGWIWSVGFMFFALLTGFGAIRALRTKPHDSPEPESPLEVVPLPGRGVQGWWLALSACASILLLATTSQITQEVAVIPFLWVLPLTIYLLTFIIAFSNERWYPRQAILIAFYGMTIFFGLALVRGPYLGVSLQLVIYSLMLFFAALLCHGELYRLRPHPAHLTRFYLMVSIGGALGGMFVTLIAPLIFKGFWELPLGIIFAWSLTNGLRVSQGTPVVRGFWRRHRLKLVLVGLILLALTTLRLSFAARKILFVERNFYGLVRVDETSLTDKNLPAYSLVHGITVHGLQFQAAELRGKPTTYYSETSGVGLALQNHPKYGQGLRVGVLGLGVGTLAAYGQPGDTYRFYEINPAVIRLAQGEGGYFSFLQASLASVEVIAGDARVSLERELAAGQPQAYDLLVLDTFSSDSIPVHLIDQEAFALYLQHLSAEGVIAVHITNGYLDLLPVVWKLAEKNGLQLLSIIAPGNGADLIGSQWILLARNPVLFENPRIKSAATDLTGYSTDLPLWTDDYNNLFKILRK